MADETEKTGKKCDPGNNQKTENAASLPAVTVSMIFARISGEISAATTAPITAIRIPADSIFCFLIVFCDPSLFCPARTYRNIGSCEGRTPDGVWSENHTCTKKQPDG